MLGRLAYSINNDLTIGANLSYDEAFETRVSADIKWRFNTNGGPGKETPKTNAAVTALTSTPSNRDVRVHDGLSASGCGYWSNGWIMSLVRPSISLGVAQLTKAPQRRAFISSSVTPISQQISLQYLASSPAFTSIVSHIRLTLIHSQSFVCSVYRNSYW